MNERKKPPNTDKQILELLKEIKQTQKKILAALERLVEVVDNGDKSWFDIDAV